MDIIRLDQQERFGSWARRWIDVGLSTEPADFDRAEQAALRAYGIVGLSGPRVVLRVPSPLAAKKAGAEAAMSLGRPVESSVAISIFIRVCERVRSYTKAKCPVWSHVWENVELPTHLLVWTAVGSRVRARVEEEVRGSPAASGMLNSFVGGAFFAGHSAYITFFRDVMGLRDPILSVFEVDEALTLSCGGVWWHEDVLAISDRPAVIRRDTQGRLHCDNGPALEYRDGWCLWYWHGVAVSRDVIERPESITIESIRAEKNAEVRRAMIQRYGYERYIADAGLNLVDSCSADHPIVGLRTARLFTDQEGDMVFLDLLNSTPEPDGSVRRYVIPVDPTAYDGRAARECLAAAASTWRKRSDPSELYFRSPEEYAPVAES